MDVPLSEKLRPKKFEDIAGQTHIVPILKGLIASNKPLSILLWGPPGCGKTSIAKIYAKNFSANFVKFSAVFNGTADLKKVITHAQNTPLIKTILFVDEIHRFNKAQQDGFLPFLEDGTITLIGATTENPSFSLNSALLSRLRVITLKELENNDLLKILQNYQNYQKKPLKLNDVVKNYLIKLSHGDGRYLLNLIENLESSHIKKLDKISEIEKVLQQRSTNYDKKGEHHFNLVSALQKSIRGSDENASIYYLARMLNGGEDPLYIIRRLIRISYEDIGLADPKAVDVCLSAFETFKILGSPEGEIAIVQAVIYLALSPKSNKVYMAHKKSKDVASKTHHLPPPMHILNAPTKMMKNLGYSKGYLYDHDEKANFSGQDYFPKNFTSFNKDNCFYSPNNVGYERELVKRLEYFNKLRKEKNNR
jgi:putative ATPase